MILTAFVTISTSHTTEAMRKHPSHQKVTALCSLCSTEEEPKGAGRKLNCGNKHVLCAMCLLKHHTKNIVRDSKTLCPFCKQVVATYVLTEICKHKQYNRELSAAKHSYETYKTTQTKEDSDAAIDDTVEQLKTLLDDGLQKIANWETLTLIEEIITSATAKQIRKKLTEKQIQDLLALYNHNLNPDEQVTSLYNDNDDL